MDSRKLLLILKCILNKQPLSDCSVTSEDWPGLVQLAGQHNIMSMLGCALPMLSAEQMPQGKELEALRKRSMMMALINSNQLHELGRLQDAFEKQGIYNMPLKGCTMRHLYPQPEMRTMNDLDVLCKPAQQKQIRKIMAELGYTDFQEGRKHDVYCKKPYVRVEMHREMVPAKSALSKYYRDVWSRGLSEPDKQYSYRLSVTDAFVYNMAHLAVHLEEGGIGIRFITDIYVFDHCEDVNREQLRQALESIGLWQLYSNVSCLAQQWFSLTPPQLDEDKAELMQRLGDFVLSGGLFGTPQDGDALAVRNEGRIGHFLKACFPGYREMCSMFPWLEKWWILLPWSWILRGFRSLLYRRSSIKAQFRASTTGDSQRGETLVRLYRDIGYYE